MKRCAQCHRKLGLGVRFRNIWNGHWWVHVRFCSVRCEAIYEVKRNDAAKRRWHAFLTRGTKRLGLMHELLPKARRFAVLLNPGDRIASASTSKALIAAAPMLGLEVFMSLIKIKRY